MLTYLSTSPTTTVRGIVGFTVWPLDIQGEGLYYLSKRKLDGSYSRYRWFGEST
jgi:hypothetical protein